ncbi:uncharacterized protein LOC131259709 [Anopheles coustani]|uniref:uncharacterized protein LOC131259709 n=1 Tax=Anopheles coustani TaxID=139045 RepID=UPI002659CB44|nr:uncharacterized protein LOC131259709 [Anopheles coustani]
MYQPSSRWPSLAVVLLTCTIAQAYVYFVPNAKHPDLEGHCYNKEWNISVPINGSQHLLERCEKAFCSSNYGLQLAGCGLIVPPAGHKLSETDFTKPYPDCCPTVVEDKTAEE